ncbi:unnamed protein product [Larinioides sclopetarius]|uniref:Uncharacterized protein n=1 Tax=Larinioides sclopetarius TaxID=280406 RepID=A0AAV2B2N5_9ARAC
MESTFVYRPCRLEFFLCIGLVCYQKLFFNFRIPLQNIYAKHKFVSVTNG